ncbi:MAG TPA: hypothetical protein VNI78_09585 [Vicinamibacterales bacterium]|nr:hypothetical protein [Vicinamibacterales bacterium]
MNGTMTADFERRKTEEFMATRLFARSCCTTPSAMCFWAVAFAMVYGAGLLVASMWPPIQAYGDTLLLLALGAACFVNFGRNRTLHCGITGPLFLMGALAAALIEAGIWTLDLAVVWGTVLVGIALAFLIEWRTVGKKSGSTA